MNAEAYALYLKANELANRYEQLREARDCYLRCLQLDPQFAPAWAKVGRSTRRLRRIARREGSIPTCPPATTKRGS